MSTGNIFKVSTSFSADSKWILPDNAIEGILLGLPAIDLVFKQGVCTYWRSLISSADFVSAHLERSKSETSSHCLIVQNDFPFAWGCPPPGPFKSIICLTAYSVIVVGSVNGLICLAGCSVTDGSPPEDIVIFNPSTGLSMQLYPPSKDPLNPDHHMARFAFWCLDGVYKVARIYSDSNSDVGANMMIEGDVWDSYTDAWYPIAPILGFCISSHYNWVSAPDVVIEKEVAASTYEASAYWVADCSDNMFVLSLNLITLVLNLTPLSSIQNLMTTECLTSALNYDNTYLIPASIGGNFVLLQKNLSKDGIYDVWTMGVDGKADWNKNSQFHLDFPFNSQFHLDFPFKRSLNCVNGKLLVKGFYSLAMYDMETGMKDVFEIKSISGISAHDFVGSLVSIKGFEYNVLLNGIIDVSWPYSFGCSKRRTGRFLKQAQADIRQSALDMALEQQKNKKSVSDVKKCRCSDESEKENKIRVLKKVVRYNQMYFQISSEEIEMLKMEKSTLKKIYYGMVVGVPSLAAAAAAVLGTVWYLELRKGSY